jgi:hypothetical protein
MQVVAAEAEVVVAEVAEVAEVAVAVDRLY